MDNAAEFREFPKMARLFRECTITEKIDGTNAQVNIEIWPSASPLPGQYEKAVARIGDFILMAGSRTRWVTPEDDNYGFARWVKAHAEELAALGPGRHFGEWWGQGIQRNYGLTEKRWSLFNVSRWCPRGDGPKPIPGLDPRAEPKWQDVLPACCGLVPVLYRGPFNTGIVREVLACLADEGSAAATGFMNPEGVVVWHTAANCGFKATIENDDQPKSKAKGQTA